jgi:hypothetical protein
LLKVCQGIEQRDRQKNNCGDIIEKNKKELIQKYHLSLCTRNYNDKNCSLQSL